MGLTSMEQLASTWDIGQKKSTHTRKASNVSQYVFGYTLSHKKFGTKKFSLELETPLEAISKHQKRYTWIFVYLNLLRAIPKYITLSYEDFKWLQTLDYEFITFRCRKCHEHGHLFHDCPLVQASKPPPNKAPSDPEGVTPNPKARKPIFKKKEKETSTPQATNTNPFVVLE